uniref:Guanine deaminase n=1 Tax=Glossina brevipalpis TaxID=37001 RepID=A0A1A9W7D0_9MUSC
MAKVFIGQIIHTKSFNDFVVFTKGFVVVGGNGQITAVGDNFDRYSSTNAFPSNTEFINLAKEEFLMPGLVDCHIHAPQMAQIGLGLDLPLLDWLNTYTFPLEAKFSDNDFASKIYKKVVADTVKNGTTLACYFGTNHRMATLILAKEALKQGQRALVGKVCSDCNSPDFYVEATNESLASTKEFIDDIKELNSSLIQPIITPRFALSCSKKLMNGLGDIAKNYNLHIQSHISENLLEIDYVKELFASSYAEAYDNAGLLTNKTIMAHGVHLEDEEMALLRKRGTSVAHCPASNTMLRSGLCDVKRLINKGIKVGLGTDVSGGNSSSVQDAILRAIDVSHHLEFIKKQEIKGTGKITNAVDEDAKYEPIDFKQAIYLATLGGAAALAMDEITGNFVVGKEFDALIIDTSKEPLHNFGFYDSNNYEKKSDELKLLEMVQKFIYVGDDRNVHRVYVAGKQIK